MKTMEKMLQEEIVELKKMMESIKKRLETAPKGSLRIARKKNQVEYYYIGDEKADDAEKERDKRAWENRNGRYMRKNEMMFVRKLAQRDYDVCVLNRAEERVNAIERFLAVYDRTCLKKLFQKTNPYRRMLITPPVVSDEEFVRQWQAVEYKGKSFGEDENVIVTEKGERVRSKSEKIIADKLYALGIPYRYEYPLILNNGVTVYPDFTILRMPMREEVYLEHFGRMDDAEYVEKVLYKLNSYEKKRNLSGSQFIRYL